uniref:Uncharacterized protein n=2 Tax=viral metagenome TaxID=1070528 RepID=A0A6M3JJQ5_9ZZZZ
MKKNKKAYYNPKTFKEKWEIVEILCEKEIYNKETDELGYKDYVSNIKYLIKRSNGEIIETSHIYIIKK